MHPTKNSVFVSALAFASAVQGHFLLEHFKAKSEEFDFQPYSKNAADTAGWYSDGMPNALVWVGPKDYKTKDFVCGKNYAPGSHHVKVAPGETVSMTYHSVSVNHRGPMIGYLAPCNGDCSAADPMKLKWTKIAEEGLITPHKAATEKSGPLGVWATDKLFRTAKTVEFQGNSPPDLVAGKAATWEVKIPDDCPPGRHVLREELIALFANKENTQHYPRCINIEVTGSGTGKFDGVVAGDLYDPKDPGITARVWERLDNYTIPGPALYNGGAGSSSDGPSATAPPASSTQGSSSSKPTPSGDACGDATTTVTSTVTVTPSSSPTDTGYAKPSESAKPSDGGHAKSSDDGYAKPSEPAKPHRHYRRHDHVF